MDSVNPDDLPGSRPGHEASAQPPAAPSPSGRPFAPGCPPGPGRPVATGGRVRRRAALPPAEAAEAEAALTERTSAIVADLGGDLTAIATGLAQRHARLEFVEQYLFDLVTRLGPLTKEGRTRACLVNWLLVVDRLERSARTLGLERRARPISFAQSILNATQEPKK